MPIEGISKSGFETYVNEKRKEYVVGLTIVDEKGKRGLLFTPAQIRSIVKRMDDLEGYHLITFQVFGQIDRGHTASSHLIKDAIFALDDFSHVNHYDTPPPNFAG